MHRFVVNVGSLDGASLLRLEAMGRENGMFYNADTHQWSNADRKQAAIFAFALVGSGVPFTYTNRKDASSGQEEAVPRSS